MRTVGIVDYGVGNFASVSRMISQLGAMPKIISSPIALDSVDVAILPGVGNFDFGIKNLIERKLDHGIKNFAANPHNKVLGICLGMQLLCDSSEEGELCGLGLIPARVRRFDFPGSYPPPVPHMGWNSVIEGPAKGLIPEPLQDQKYYFAHSFYVHLEDESNCAATTNHGIDFCSAFAFKNVFGVQFHPEKSHKFGQALLSSFLRQD